MTRPNTSTPRTSLSVLHAPRPQSNENAIVPALRPCVSHRRPTIGPNSAVDAKPVRKSRDTQATAVDDAVVVEDAPKFLDA